jgi:phosphoribosylamine--glycine ligase/phosphoribosylaminoimidazole synthetase
MRVLIIGSGGREHALAWKITQSGRLAQLYCAPGNPGMAEYGELAGMPVNAVERLTSFAVEKHVDLAVIGPEQALEAGITDALTAAGVHVFGPTRAAAQIETSKAFCKAFMARHGIPTARFAVFDNPAAAHEHVETIDYPLVLKASGLAAGKGVLLPESIAEAHQFIDQMMVEQVFGAASEKIVIEECLFGEEISLMAFCDGFTAAPMLPAQDHKRLLDDDAGPNTGGMGAYAPVSIFAQADIQNAAETILRPAVDGLRAEGTPFTGVLYAGLMLTADGPKVLEFNARFGDPETQVVLPLLESDLLDVLSACAEGRLAGTDVRWKDESAVCVVAASAGYPEKAQSGKTLTLPEKTETGAIVFQAGTRRENGQLLTSGGRVLGVTALGADFTAARQKAYRLLEKISFEGMQYRQDIGAREANRQVGQSAYRQSGVDIDAGNRAVKLMSAAVKSTYNERVLAGIGAFGGLYDAAALKTMRSPVLVASTDGVGTKVKLAAQLNRLEGIGEDIVNHCIDDILVQGARPLFFLDYYASSQMRPEGVAAVVSGISKACRESGVVLLGGETAEMPGVYAAGEFDVAGTIVGVLEKDRLLPRADMRAGDVLLGFASSGPHTNGYSLIRKITADEDLNVFRPELGSSLADALLRPHRSYLNLLIDLLEQENSPIKALAHLTGGGFIENIPRVLPQGLAARIRKDSWAVPPLFRWLGKAGKLDEREMYRVFNMGIGMLAVVAPDRVSQLQASMPEECLVIGELVDKSQRKVLLV